MTSKESGLQTFLNQLDPNLSYGQAKSALLTEFERLFVSRLLETNRGNITLAARTARTDRKHLSDLIKKHHLEDVRQTASASNADLQDS